MAERICSIAGCGRAGNLSRGWCVGHYRRWQKTGDLQEDVPLLERPKCSRTDMDPYHFCPDALGRFWGKVDKDHPQGCWVWARGTNRGYGVFQPHNWMPAVVAHRYSYTLLVGQIPDGLQLDHLCRNRACVNPGHLEPVTAKINVYRSEGVAAYNAQKTHCPAGHEYPPFEAGCIRDCRVCKRATGRRSYARQTETQRARRRERDRESARRRKANR